MTVSLSDNETIKKILYIIMIPLTVISLILTIVFIFIWPNLLSIDFLNKITDWLIQWSVLYFLVKYVPVWIFLHWLGVFGVMLELKKVSVLDSVE